MHVSPTTQLPQPMPAMPRVRTDDLMAGSREIVILHNGQEYHLRITNAGKLILTK